MWNQKFKISGDFHQFVDANDVVWTLAIESGYLFGNSSRRFYYGKESSSVWTGSQPFVTIEDAKKFVESYVGGVIIS